MSRRRAIVVIAVLFFLGVGCHDWLAQLCSAGQASSGTQAATAGPFRAGASVVDITPRRFPVSMLGSFSDRPATGANDPLCVRSLVLDDGKLRVAIAVCDVCVIPRELCDQAKQLASKATGIPLERILVAATHTHTAPAVVSLMDAIPVDVEYTKLLVRWIAEGIGKAAARLAPAKIGWGGIDVPEEVHNRRWFMKQETVGPNPFGGTDRVRMNPGAGGPDLLKPAGPTDPQVSVLSVVSTSGKPLALLANYSLHYVGGIPAGMLSADYFGEFTRQIRQRLAPGVEEPEFVGILTNGTSGDCNNVNFRQPRPRAEPMQRIREVASRIADAAAEVQRGIKHSGSLNLAMAQREIALGVRKPNAQELAQAKEILATTDAKPANARVRYYAEAGIRLSQWPDEVKILLQALRIGELGIVSTPCETFAEIGLEIKRRSPLRPTFTIQLANGYNGYLPTPEQHAVGGYETWRAVSSYLEVQASRKMTETLMELLEAVRK